MDIIDTVKSVLPYVIVLIFGIISTIVAHYLIIPRIDTFLKKQRKKRLEESKKASEDFEARVNYYLWQTNGKIEAVIDYNNKTLYFPMYFIISMIFLATLMVAMINDRIDYVFISLLFFGIFLISAIIAIKQRNYLLEVISELDNRL